MDTPFIQALSKCLQSFCNGHVQYDKDVRILGHLYVSVDSKDNNYFLNENLCRSNESHVSVLSKSFAVPPVAFSDGNNIQAQNVNQQSLQQPQFNAQNPLQDVNQQSLQNSLISQDDMSNNLVGFKEANLQLEEVSDITFNSELKPEMFGDRVLNSGVVFSPKDNRGKRRKTSNPMRSDGGGGGMSSLCCCDDIKDSFDLSGSRLKCPVHQMKMEPDIIGFDEDDDYNDDGGQDSEMDTHKRDQLQIGRVWSMSEDSSAAGASDSSYSATKKSKKVAKARSGVVVVSQRLEAFCGTTCQKPPTVSHHLQRLEGKKEKDCVVCSKRTGNNNSQGRKRTRHWCPACKVGCHELCEVNLFHETDRGLKKKRTAKKAESWVSPPPDLKL